MNKEGEYEIGRFPDGTIQWAMGNSSPGWAWFNTGVVAPTNQWTHLVLVYSNSVACTYVNGTLAHAKTCTGNVGDAAPSQNDFRIGGRQGVAQLFQGSIDEVGVYSRVLTSNEIAGLYTLGSAGKCFTNDPSPVFLQHPQNQTGYLLNSITFSAAAMGTPRPTYQWQFNGNPIFGATNAILILTNLTLTNAGNYSVLASNSAGAHLSDMAVLDVVPLVLLRDGTTIASNNTNYDGQDVIISGGTVIIDGTHRFNSVQVTNGGTITHSLGTNLNLTVAGDFTVSSNSVVSASGKGYGSASGPGAGVSTLSGNGGGGGHGGNGGNGANGSASGGVSYNSLTAPTLAGSGGGSGAYGGGRVLN